MIALKRQLREYLEAHCIEPGTESPADVVLAYLRIGTPLALIRAEQIMGKPITRCPPAVPPWPPKPVSKPRCSVVARVNPRSSKSKNGRALPAGSCRTFRLIRRGMTKEQLLVRGVSRRDISRWTRSGHIVWKTT